MLIGTGGADYREECDGCPCLHMAVCIAAHKTMEAAAAAIVAKLLEAGADPYQRQVPAAA
jgi:hypothetical protein